MVTLFLGEYFRLPILRRGWLVLGGAAISLALNCVRVLALALVFQSKGEAVAMHYHDAAGTLATAATFLAVFVLAAVLRQERPMERAPAPTIQPERGYGGFAMCAACVAIPMMSQVWFSHVGGQALAAASRTLWTLDPSALPPRWHSEPVEPRPGERADLQFSTWQGYRVRNPDGSSAQVIHLGWKPGASMPSLAFYHTPALCMPWVGWTEVGRPKKTTLPLRTGNVPCVAYRFMQEGVGILVLQSLSSGGQNGYHILDPEHLENRWHRLLTLWQAPLRQVNEELLIYLPASGDEDTQTHAAAAILDALLVAPAR
jgi:exosortase/archaeosortase family protein